MGKRLQIRNHAEVFDTRDSALAYINDIYKGQSLVAEPTVYLYGSALNPNIILAIGSVGNGSLAAKNKVFLIDTARLDADIAQLKQDVSGDTENIQDILTKLNAVIVGSGLDSDGTYQVDIDDDLLKKATSLNDAIKKLSASLQATAKATDLTVKDSETVHLETTKTSTGVLLQAFSKISEYGKLDPDFNDNILIKMSDGLYATVDLSYDENTGILTFTASKTKDDGTVGVRIIEKQFKIGLHTTMKSVSYDPETETLIFILTDADGNEYTEVVDATGLITEWDVENKVGSAVYLTKTRVKDGQDKLSADVIISSGDGWNILEKSKTTGGLFVKGYANNIKYKTDVTVENALDTLTLNDQTNLADAKAYTDAQVSAETNRAKGAEQVLTDNLVAEVTRAKAAEKANADAIAIINGDNDTVGSIKTALKDAKAYTDIETDRAKSAEQALQVELNTLNGNEAVSGSVKNAISIAKQYTDTQVDAEQTRAEAAEQVLTNAVTIINGNEAQEGSIKNAIVIANEYTDEQLAQHDHDSLIKIDELRDDLNAEIKRATITGKESKSLLMNIAQGSTGTTISGDVKISTITGNIISEQDGGIFAYVTLKYNAAENALYFNNGTPVDTKIQLSSASLVDDAYYDASTKTIIIVFNDADKTTVKIPVGDLIPTLAVGRETGSAVIMRLVTEENLNTIYADVDISTASVNILQNVNGALLVRGTADNIKYGQNSNVEAALDNLTSASTGNLAAAKAYTDEQVAIEKARAEGVESTLNTTILNNTTNLQGQITAEVTRATKAEEAETKRAEAAEAALDAKIGVNSDAITIINSDSGTTGSIANAVATAKAATDTAIENEKDRAKAAEAALDAKIAIINGSGVGSMSDILDKAKAYTDTSIAPIAGQIENAKQQAIAAAATDATTKADKAKQEAIATAATDATTKANSAETNAISAAAIDATTKADKALSDAKLFTTSATTQALADAKAYTDAQHIYVTGASVNASTNVITLGFQNSVQTVNIDISSIIEAAVTKAVTQAVAQAKQEIQYTIVPTSSTNGTVDNSKSPREISIDVTNVNNGTYTNTP